MRPSLLGAVAILSIAACDDPTRPAEPTSAFTPTVVASAAAARLQPRSLGTLGGTFSQGLGINGRSEVAGIADLPSGELRGFVWRSGAGMQTIGTLGGANSVANGLNDRSEIVGESELRPGSDASRAFIWSETGGMNSLGTLGGRHSSAAAVNNRREVVGASELRDGTAQAFLWVAGRGMRRLGTLGGPNSSAADINDDGVVVGAADLPDGSFHAFRWTAARGMEDLGTLGGALSEAVGISQTGEITGIAGNGLRGEAFLWTRGRGMRGLGTLGGLSLGASINTHRRVVGWSSNAIGGDLLVPFLWTPGAGIEALPTLGGDFGQAHSLNEFGDIAGESTRPNGALRATLWRPTAGPLATTGGADQDETAVGIVDRRPAACAAARKITAGSRPTLAGLKSCIGR